MKKSILSKHPKEDEKNWNWLKILNFLKTIGIFIEGAKIYQGLKNTYDFGPLGNHIKQTIKSIWWKKFVTNDPLIEGMDSGVFTSPQILQASGHLKKFIDDVWLCNNCKKIFKVEEIVKKKHNKIEDKETNEKNQYHCLECQQPLDVNSQFTYNLLFKTFQGINSTKQQEVFLRPETAQGIFTNFKYIHQTLKLSLPFGIAQIGKAFRNEITTQYGIFRTCEFEQMELEFFYENSESFSQWWTIWSDKMNSFLTENIQLNHEKVRINEHFGDKLAHYSQKTIDFEYHFPFGWKELCGLADRGNFDLSQHQKASQTNLTILNNQQKPVLPMVIEPSFGIDRLVLALVLDKIIIDSESQKITLALPRKFCYYEIALLPLTQKLTEKAQKILPLLQDFRVRFDDKKSIGKRYLFHDQIGTYFCITYDFESEIDQTVTLRNRNTKLQKRIKIQNLATYLKDVN